ncbi:MAG: glycine--tRNA ligase [Candidatus Levybacteria bacterium]|nr:glycine--tRNA ligase [Candidatus Levybacteria bacterium]
MSENKMDMLQALFKRRGFVYPGSELYGGVANTYDYGPVGTELLRNIKNLWWKVFVQKRDDIVGLDASLISHHKIWEASGHVAGFADALVDCKSCRTRIRADHLIEDYLEKIDEQRLKNEIAELHLIDHEKRNIIVSTKKVEGLSPKEMEIVVQHFKIPCPNCAEFNWTVVRKFNQLFPVQLGIVEGEQGSAYLRGETAQGIFVDFDNIVNSNRVRLPFGVAQIGKSFRNEITLGNSVFRTIEFEQGEIEYFFNPEKNDWKKLFDDWKDLMWKFITDDLGVRSENLRWREHSDEERSFYSKKTEDLEYNFPFGFKELWGLAYRTDYDLKQHSTYSGKELAIVDPETFEKVVPHVIEPAVGINRLFLMILSDAYHEDGERVVLKLSPRLAPYKVAVFPLLKNKPELVEKAKEVYVHLKDSIGGVVVWDDRGNIGKRYLSQDEIGTPFCVTVDFDTLENDTVTIRDRDTANQERVQVDKLSEYITKKII